jgi:hypothetical protein
MANAPAGLRPPAAIGPNRQRREAPLPTNRATPAREAILRVAADLEQDLIRCPALDMTSTNSLSVDHPAFLGGVEHHHADGLMFE